MQQVRLMVHFRQPSDSSFLSLDDGLLGRRTHRPFASLGTPAGPVSPLRTALGPGAPLPPGSTPPILDALACEVSRAVRTPTLNQFPCDPPHCSSASA